LPAARWALPLRNHDDAIGSGLVTWCPMADGGGHPHGFPTHVTTGLNWEFKPAAAPLGQWRASPTPCYIGHSFYSLARPDHALSTADELAMGAGRDCAAARPQRTTDGWRPGPQRLVSSMRSRPCWCEPRSPHPVLLRVVNVGGCQQQLCGPCSTGTTAMLTSRRCYRPLRYGEW